MHIQNKDLTLEMSQDGRLTVTLQEKYRWECAAPILILRYYDRQHPRAQTVGAPSPGGQAYGTAGTPSLSCAGQLRIKTESQTVAHIEADFPSLHIRISLEILLDSERAGFVVRVAEITEGVPGLFRILGIEILPEFGAAKTGEAGYLTLPNWSGCQTFFDKSYPREVRQTIYSSNDQWENLCNMPVFGITREQGTMCGLVAAGDYDAQLVCRCHWEEDETNGVHPCLMYRWKQQDELMPGAREVRYAFAAPDDSCGEGYVFCGKVYRDFLRCERGLQTWEEKAVAHPDAIDFRDRFFLKIFMAYKVPQADGHGTYHSTCTFAEVRQILEDCLVRGMKKLAVMLVGWGQDGHDGMPPTRFPVDERLGGESAFRDLIAWCRAGGILLGVHDSYGESYSSSPEFDENDLICHRTGERWQGVVWSGGQVNKICPSVFVDKHTRRDVPAVRALGIHGHHHIDAIGSFMTCYSKTHPLERRQEFAKQVATMFEFVRDQIGSVSTEMPFGPYFAVVDGFYHSYTDPSPWNRASDIGRFFLDRTVPLLQVALHGSVNCCEPIGKFRNDPLYWLDKALCPQWEVCMRASDSFGIPAYDSVADEMAAIYDLYYGTENLASMINPLEIVSRSELAEGVSTTHYSDGTQVRVNRSPSPREGLSAQSFRIEIP